MGIIKKDRLTRCPRVCVDMNAQTARAIEPLQACRADVLLPRRRPSTGALAVVTLAVLVTVAPSSTQGGCDGVGSRSLARVGRGGCSGVARWILVMLVR